MKKLWLVGMVVAVSIIFVNSPLFAETKAGFANSTFEVLDPQTLKVFGVTIDGVEGLWWVKFAWDADELKLIPIDVGSEESERGGDCAAGAWTMTFDWDCDGTARTTSWNLFPDHNFVAGGTETGTWTQSGRQVFLTYENKTSYAGNIEDLENCSYMTGKMSKGTHTGCFYAYRVSKTDTGSYDDSDTKILTGEEWLAEKAKHLNMRSTSTCPCPGLITPCCKGDYYIAGYTEVVDAVVVDAWGDDSPGPGGFVNLESHTLYEDGVVCHDHIKAAVCNPY